MLIPSDRSRSAGALGESAGSPQPSPPCDLPLVTAERSWPRRSGIARTPSPADHSAEGAIARAAASPTRPPSAGATPATVAPADIGRVGLVACRAGGRVAGGPSSARLVPAGATVVGVASADVGRVVVCRAGGRVAGGFSAARLVSAGATVVGVASADGGRVGLVACRAGGRVAGGFSSARLVSAGATVVGVASADGGRVGLVACRAGGRVAGGFSSARLVSAGATVVGVASADSGRVRLVACRADTGRACRVSWLPRRGPIGDATGVGSRDCCGGRADWQGSRLESRRRPVGGFGGRRWLTGYDEDRAGG